jgi:O-antigen ligase
VRLRDRIAIGAGAGGLGVAVLAVGGALRPAQAAVAALVAVALGALVPSRRRLDRASPLVCALGLGAALTALQLVPLPDAVALRLSPAGAALRDQGVEIAGVGYWPSLSMDAAGSLAALAFFLILLGVAAVALRFSATERGRYRVIAAVAAVCGLVSVVVGIHELLGATSLYGVYEPAQATPTILGPLLNTNHLAGLTGMGAVAALALFATGKQRTNLRVLWAIVGVACLATSLACDSRGGRLALIAGGVVAAVVLVAQRLLGARERNRAARRRQFLSGSLPLGIVTLCALVLIVLVSPGGGGRELSETSLSELGDPRSKFAAWSSSVELIREAPWVGIGRGALEPAFTRVHPASAHSTFSHLENEYVQAVVEWGIPGAAAMALVLGWLALVAVRRWRDGPLAAGALGALAAIAVQSNVDFGMELLGVAVPAVALAATVAYVPLREVVGGALWRARAVRALHVAALGAAALILMSPLTTSVAEEHEAWTGRDVPVDELRASIERHPLDYLGYARVADALLRRHDPGGVRYLNHALMLHPTHPGLHTIAARLLHNAGRDPQAAIEYAAAIRGSLDPRPTIREVAARLRDPEHVVAAIPADHPNLDLVVRLLRQIERPDLAAAWLARVLEQRPKDVRVCEYLYAISIEQRDLKAAEAAGRRCLAVVPSHQRRIALARVLMQRGAFQEVVQQLGDIATWRGRIGEISSAWLLLCEARESLEQWTEAVHCLRRLDGRNLVELKRREEITRRIERIEKARVKADLEAAPPAPPDGGVTMPKILK